MDNFDRQSHWENIYHTKPLTEVSWYQPMPTTSLERIAALNLPKTARIIDVGGGDSFLADNLLDLGYIDITVLDVSQTAINRAKTRLGMDAYRIKWLTADAANFIPVGKYDLWHDRAAFHFLTGENEITNYIATANRAVPAGGYLIVGTFSHQGPTKCSGIPITQYSPDALARRFTPHFEKIDCFTVNHTTPSGKTQNFTFCTFTKPS